MSAAARARLPLPTLRGGPRRGLVVATALATAGSALGLVASGTAHAADAPTTVQVSVTTGGFNPDHGSNGDTGSASVLSTDGRYVVFASSGPVIAGQAQLNWQIVRRDRQLGTSELISKSSTGEMGNGNSYEPSVSVGADGAQASRSSTGSGISGDGQHVAFNSYAQLSSASTGSWQQAYVRDLTGKYPALRARIGALPGRVTPKDTNKIKTFDIRTGPALVVTWTPVGSTRSATVQNAAVSGNSFTLRSPKRAGSYTLSVSYAGNVLRSRTVKVVKPTAKKLPAQVKATKVVKVRTVGLSQGTTVNVQFKPRGTTGGKAVKRSAKVNKAGVAKVAAPSRRGSYQVVVRGNGDVLRKGALRVR